jgi:hypothetical protein
MMAYQITSSAGVDMGTYEADTAEGALDAMARDAGYRDQVHAAEVAGPFDGTVREIGTACHCGPGEHQCCPADDDCTKRHATIEDHRSERF